ncbi:toll/interleukin-1 receptor domain-containing protein [Methylocapsa sp. S129]|uniref:toll/interleukin-1 receptor domain-containing protein n=1 Tax=Methylocapsa sp. S129 TaxID=1641869 RepID=UPI00131C9185|nr:toll/interleukin-1 receptor domain-containing protein [Methylocapsa sp. S129]
MIDYITPDYLRRNAGTLNEQASTIRKAQSRSPAGSTFLSHSSKDVDSLPGVIAILERHGAEVYVDKKDESLPPYTSRETATILRGRIRQCRRFILFTTQNSKDSRWIPWELGLADGYKSATSTAVFPSPDNAHEPAWSEQEYLGIYDRVVYGGLAGHAQPIFMVWNQEKNTAQELSAWLRE